MTTTQPQPTTIGVLTPGSWRVVSFVDDRASDEQFQAIVDAYRLDTVALSRASSPDTSP